MKRATIFGVALGLTLSTMASPARTASTSTNTETAPVPTATVRYVTPPAEWFRRMREAVQDTTP